MISTVGSGGVSVVREQIAQAAPGSDPIAAAAWLRDEPRPVALSGDWGGGGVILSSHPLAVAGPRDDPFALLDTLPPCLAGGTDPAATDGVPTAASAIGGGWFGWLGFQLGRALESLPPPPPRPRTLPDFSLAFHDHLVRCDADGDWWFEALWSPERDPFLRGRLECWRARLSSPAPAWVPVQTGPVHVTGAGLAGHREAVAETVSRIAAGDVSQANICLRLEGSFDGDPLDLWLRATSASRPAYAAYIGPDSSGHAVVSLSPELFLRRTGSRVETRPIKGTLPLDQDPQLLVSSAKDRAENVMIVDLMRNDLGRVCAYGSVTVEGLCALRRAPGVWHLESTVSGRLRAGVGDGGLLRASFPPGSVTGAPKIQALRTIHELECSAREAYCGAVGICSPLRGLELNVAIRTLETAAGRLWLGAGGGIVADSSPEAEVEEALAKARGALAPAGLTLAARATTGPSGAGRRNPRAPAVRSAPVTMLSRPDPSLGVIETIRVAGGRASRLAAHLGRLRASAAALGITPVGASLERELALAAAGLGEGAIRVDLDRGGHRLTTRPLPVARESMLLEPVRLAGGLGAHKWADRRLIDSLSGDGVTPLICDLDGAVLEAGYAAVLAICGDALVAPPLDGRQLPSVSRAETLAAAETIGLEIEIRGLWLEELEAADAIILTSSLRGAHPGRLAASVGDETATLARATAICERLAASLGDKGLLGNTLSPSGRPGPG